MARPSYYKKLDILFYVLLIALFIATLVAFFVWDQNPDNETAKNVCIVAFVIFILLLVVLFIVAKTTSYNFTYTLLGGKTDNVLPPKPKKKPGAKPNAKPEEKPDAK